MYIAFKWLVGISVAMWLAMCSLQIILKRNTKPNLGIYQGVYFHSTSRLKNYTLPKPKKVDVIVLNSKSVTLVYCLIITVGALAFSIFQKEFIKIFTEKNLAVNNLMIWIFHKVQSIFKNTARCCCIAVVECLIEIKNIYRNTLIKMRSSGYEQNTTEYRQSIKCKTIVDYVFLKKLKEFDEERKTLKSFLMTALNENRRIRMQYQLQVMAKDRFKRYNEDSQKLIKENRFKCIHLQQLYWVAQQENLFLKKLVQKLQEAKKEADLNCVCLINEINKSSDEKLKANCRNFVTTKDVSLNSDLIDVRQSILQQCNGSNNTFNKNEFSTMKRQEYTSITELKQDNHSLLRPRTVVSRFSGEYFWTVKDKNGKIEKLYDYSCQSVGNCDVIHRIRQYTVYYDKDYLLDFTKSNTSNSDVTDHTSKLYKQLPPINNRFLTGSEEFHNFMKNNKGVILPFRKS
ncbi:uncharacterized protein LOC101736696 isoform X1 [Bombyx mori]|uniref:Uncharacterized protein n=1 Tax=Bombyx mori TaxID=7091 RepID=A0A8R2AHW8_BOMMO|nr:uncharacterized protein LOC101736696 isoform X1 [Bombyx mori]